LLAYVFWHWPDGSVDPTRYEGALLTFHRALAAAPPAGARGSRVLAVAAAPWLPVARGYEDWYFVDDFAALGALNEAAVTASRREPHDAAARLAAGGTAGVYRLLSGMPDERAPGPLESRWLSKPGALSYADFLARLPPGELWQRQMTLGPTPEFDLLGAAAPPEVTVCTLSARLLYRSTS
jgi:hypothetical protein